MALSRRSLIATDPFDLHKVSDVCLSADGQSVIFAIQYSDCRTGRNFTDTWVAPIHAGEPEHFSYQDKPENQPRWLNEITRKA